MQVELLGLANIFLLAISRQLQYNVYTRLETTISRPKNPEVKATWATVSSWIGDHTHITQGLNVNAVQ